MLLLCFLDGWMGCTELNCTCNEEAILMAISVSVDSNHERFLLLLLYRSLPKDCALCPTRRTAKDPDA